MKKLLYIKILFLFVIVSHLQAETKFSEKEVMLELKEMRLPPLQWTILLSYSPSLHKKGEMPESLKGEIFVPDFKLFDNKELKGSPYLELKNEKIYVKGESICFLSKHEYVSRFKNDVKDYRKGRCEKSPFFSFDFIDRGTGHTLVFDKIDKNIGELEYHGKKLFMDISKFKDHYIHIPTEIYLRRLYTKEQFNKIKSLLEGLRRVVLTNDLDKVSDYILKDNFSKKQDHLFTSRSYLNKHIKKKGKKQALKDLYKISYGIHFPYVPGYAGRAKEGSYEYCYDPFSNGVWGGVSRSTICIKGEESGEIYFRVFKVREENNDY